MEPRRIVIKSEDKRLVYGEVYAPLYVDTDGESMTAEEIERMAHKFLASGRTSKIDIQHNQQESGAQVVESFIARENDPDGFVLGSWVLGVKIPEEYWEAVKSGELNGFSFFGHVQKTQPMKMRVRMTRSLKGETESTPPGGLLPPHKHDLNITFKEDGSVLEGRTDITLGHVHRVVKSTATESALDHSHRMVLINNE